MADLESVALRDIFAELVQRHLGSGDWDIVAVASVSTLQWTTRDQIHKAFGCLRDPILIVVERREAAELERD